MRDVQNAHAELAVEAGEQFQDFGMSDGVERACGLIGDQERRTVYDRHGDEDALGLADGDLAGVAIEKVRIAGEIDHLEEFEQVGSGL